MLRSKLFGTKNIVNCLKNSSVRWFFSSTSQMNQVKKILESDKKTYFLLWENKLLAENFIIKKLKIQKLNIVLEEFLVLQQNQKNYLVPDLIKIKITKKITLCNLNHYRDFITMNLISKLFYYYLKKYNGIINIGRGKKFC